MPLGHAQSPFLTVVFLAVFVTAFFPNIFLALLKSPVRLFSATPTTIVEPYLCPSGCLPTDHDLPMSWYQKQLTLPAKPRGSYLITDTVVSQLPELKTYKVGLLNLFIQHTSCALSLNENWDSDVRADMSDSLDRIVPEDKRGDLYRHSCEGSDDMPV